MAYNFVAHSIHTKKLCSNFLQAKCNFRRKIAVLRFNPPWGLRATYDVHIRLTGKRILNFLLVLIGLFSLGVTADEALRLNIY